MLPERSSVVDRTSLTLSPLSSRLAGPATSAPTRCAVRRRKVRPSLSKAEPEAILSGLASSGLRSSRATPTGSPLAADVAFVELST